MIPDEYLLDAGLLKGAMLVVACTEGKNEEEFLGALSLTRKDGSFHKDALPSSTVLGRFLQDGYIEHVPNQSDWYRKAR